MYDIGDDDLAKSYDAKKVAGKLQLPKLPKVDVQYDADLLRVTKEVTPIAGKQYVFKFKVIKSNNEIVPEEAIYKHVFYPGNGSEVDSQKFWGKITPLLMAVFGETDALTFNAVDKLGELMSLSKGTEDLGLRFRGTRVLQDVRPDKATGKYKPDDLEADGKTPKKFPRDTYLGAAAAS